MNPSHTPRPISRSTPESADLAPPSSSEKGGLDARAVLPDPDGSTLAERVGKALRTLHDLTTRLRDESYLRSLIDKGFV